MIFWRRIIFGLIFTPAAHAAGPTGENLLTTLVALVLVICVIFLLGKLLKGLQGSSIGMKSKLKIISQLPVGQKERVLVLDVNGKQILVGVTSMQITFLMELDNPIIETDTVGSLTSQFQEIIRKKNPSEMNDAS